MNPIEHENVRLALGIIDNDINEDIKIPFLNNKKFKLKHLKQYLEGLKLIQGKYHDDLINVLIYTYNNSIKSNNVNTITIINELYDTYEPFKQMYNNYIRKHIKRKNLHTMLFGIETLCHGDVFIYGRILHRIENNLTTVKDYECISIYYEDDKKRNNFISRLNDKFETFIIHHNTTKLIFLKGIPRIIQMIKINDVHQDIINKTSIYEQIYLNEKIEIIKTQEYHYHDKYDISVVDNKPTSYSYYREIMSQTNNLADVWQNDTLEKIFYDQHAYNETHVQNSHLFY